MLWIVSFTIWLVLSFIIAWFYENRMKSTDFWSISFSIFFIVPVALVFFML